MLFAAAAQTPQFCVGAARTERLYNSGYDTPRHFRPNAAYVRIELAVATGTSIRRLHPSAHDTLRMLHDARLRDATRSHG